MTIDGAALRKFLESVKPITTKRFNVPYEDWVFLDGNFAYAFNGLYFYVTPFDAPEIMALPSKRTLLFLPNKDEEIGVLLGKDSVKLDSKSSQVEFSYPFKSIEDYTKSFYLEKEPMMYEAPDDLLQCLEFCSQTIFKENIEYSNIYVHEGYAYSSDGSRISVYPCDIPDTSLSIGVEKVLKSVGEPDSLVVHNSVTSFGIGEAVLSVGKNIGEHTAITNYIPPTDMLDYAITFHDRKEIMKVLKKAQAFDAEFKRKDSQVIVSVSKDEGEIRIEGVTSKFSETVDMTSTKDVTFMTHPSHLHSICEMEGQLYFGDVPYMQAKDVDAIRYLWVDML
jgi:hypothetical protein